MATLYSVIKFFHILFVVIALGANLTYGLWFLRAKREPSVLKEVLEGIHFIDRRFANPSYAFVLMSGIFLLVLGQYPLDTPWIVTGIALWLAAAAGGIFGFTPALKAQIKQLEAWGADSIHYQKAARRTTLVGLLTTLPVVLALYVMVTKPAALI